MTDIVGIATGLASIVSVLGVIYGFINHKRIRLRLCGRKLSASIHIDDKTAETTVTAVKAERAVTAVKTVNEPVIVHTRRVSTHATHHERPHFSTSTEVTHNFSRTQGVAQDH